MHKVNRIEPIFKANSVHLKYIDMYRKDPNISSISQIVRRRQTVDI